MSEEQPAKDRLRIAALGWRSLAIAGAAASTGLTVLIARGDAPPPAEHYRVADADADPARPSVDPLVAELARCRSLGGDTADARCRLAWEVNRRRFMGESRSLTVEVEPKPTDPSIAAANGTVPSPSRER